jgi:predicted O-methyltransferase YrrM
VKIDVAEFRGRQVVGFMSEEIFTRLDWLIRKYEIRTVVELGAFVGLSTCFLAERVERVITVDNFDVAAQDYKPYLRPIHEAAAADQYAEFLRNTLAYPNITGIRMDFLQAAALPIEADMVYIDGVQSYPTFKKIVNAWLPKARKVIAGDDTQAKAVRRTVEAMGVRVVERTWWKPL